MRCSISGQRLTCQGSQLGFMRMSSSLEMPIHCSTTGVLGERRRVSPANSRTLRRMGTILNSVVHCRRIMPTSTRPLARTVRVTPECPALARSSIEKIVPDIAGRDDMDRKRQDVGRHQPGKMVHDRLRFPAGIGEDGAVGHRPDDAVGGKQGQSGRLHASAKAEYAQADRGRRGAICLRGWSAQHHAASASLAAG